MSVPQPLSESKLRPLDQPVLIRRLQLPAERASLLHQQISPANLLDHLSADGLLIEAARLLAYALPEREAVWWGCMCVSHTVRQSDSDEQKALEAAQAWVWHPGEATGRQAARAAAGAGYDLPGAWTALAAYWGQRPGRQPGRVGRGVETAATLAAARSSATANSGPQAMALLRRFVASGRDIAAGGAGRLPPMTGETDTPA